MKRLSLLILIAASVGALHMALYLSPWGHSLEMKFLDLWFHLRGPLSPPGHVAIVAMDEDSYKTLDIPLNQAWPRALHAKLLNRLKELGAKRVVFDVLFLDPGSDSTVDEELAQSMSALPTVLGADLGKTEERNYEKEEILFPLNIFKEKAEKIALVGLPEEEGHIRHFLSRNSELESQLPSLSEAALSKREFLPSARDFIHYYGPPRTIPTYSYDQVLEKEFPINPQFFQDKIVFVGLSLRTALGPAEKDAYLTPFSKDGRMFGVEIHATATENLITGQWIRRAPKYLELGVLFLVTWLLSLLLLSISPVPGIFFLAGAPSLWALAAYEIFLKGLFIPGALLTTVILPLNYLGSTLLYYIVIQRKKRQLERAFQFYISPEMAREVARNPEALRLGGEKVMATAMFTDIEGFTEKSESMAPEAVAHMLNAYFTEVMNEIFEKKGTLIKFIGDAVFALWGSPIKTPDHAQLACETALSIQKEIEKFNASDRFPSLKTRIGLHTGSMVVGNLGSSKRFDFTAIGDSINLASRVEGINKYFGTDILITNSVLDQLKRPLPYLELGTIQVVGKKETVTVYSLLHAPLPDPLRNRWLEALQQFKNRQWEEASKTFEKLLSGSTPLKKPCEFYLQQIKFLRSSGIPQAWKGEIIFSSK
ncbi:MAG: adenylate/guanylate cyclase domain-containing protein [Chlamydiae bacterium]|nr:adenylate/guanylate cyclase domain-containing protein [Chlamydiota bacterium]MBI3265678.1 adenylate/guanylate cyclase domain-containing protein [Chlamydiota bacterium]